MKPIEPEKIKAIYEYLSASNLQHHGDVLFVYGRADPRVPETAAELYTAGWAPKILFGGGIGKDSGPLARLRIPEAHYMASIATIHHNIPTQAILTETESENGAQAATKGLETLLLNNVPVNNTIIVAHPTSLVRLERVHALEWKNKGVNAHLQRTSTRYDFNPRNPIDQKEAIAELLRLADWPAKGWCIESEDLPHDLVEYAREINLHALNLQSPAYGTPAMDLKKN